MINFELFLTELKLDQPLKIIKTELLVIVSDNLLGLNSSF